MKKMLKLGISTAVLCLLWQISAFGYSAPTKNSHFFGDADGNLTITPADLTQHNNYLVGKAYTYDTLQPPSSATKWNTCDMDHNRACTPADITQMNNYMIGKTVFLGNDDPWGLVTTLTGTLTVGEWVPFQVGLFATVGGSRGGGSGHKYRSHN